MPKNNSTPAVVGDHDGALVLVVDDDRGLACLVARWLERVGFKAEVHADAESMLDAFSRSLPDAVCLDLGLPGMSGQDALALIRARHRTVPTLVLTADREPSTVVSAIQMGAHDYLTKPLDRTKVTTAVRNAVQHHRLGARVRQLERETQSNRFMGILGQSVPMQQLFRQLDRVVASDITVLIQGESGTGKELVARAIHEQSARSDGPLVAVNCAAIPPSLQDSEFFGHEKGAFTGADQARAGRFEQANGGTLFLDEVAELPADLQAKLLRVLQERRFERVGGRKSLPSDFRLIAATHRDLLQMVERGEFRQDLFFRLAVLELRVPPLRERGDDTILLARTLLASLAAEAKVDCPRFDPHALDLLRAYGWPGNVRELRNCLQRALVVCDGQQIQATDFPARIWEGTPPRAHNDPPPAPAAPAPAEPPPPKGLGGSSLAEIERAAIEAAIRSAGGNLSEVTRRLGIGRTTLYRRLKKHGLR